MASSSESADFGGDDMSKPSGNGEPHGVGVGLADGASGLSLRQASVVDALARGQTPTRAARTCKVSRSVVYLWLQDDNFRGALQARRAGLAAALADRLAELGQAAIAAVIDFLQTEDRSGYSMEPAKIKVAERTLVGLGLLADAGAADRD
jgi:hypothetical protein